MYMLPQILNISTENFIINQIISNLKSKLSELLDEFIIDNSKNRYVNIFLKLQNLINEISVTFISNLFETLEIKYLETLLKEKKNIILVNLMLKELLLLYLVLLLSIEHYI